MNDKFKYSGFVGMEFSTINRVEKEHLENYIKMSTDNNPIHYSDSVAQRTIFKTCIVPGVVLLGFVAGCIENSARLLLKNHIPIIKNFEAKFINPAHFGDVIKTDLLISSTKYNTIGAYIYCGLLKTNRTILTVETNFKLIEVKEEKTECQCQIL